MIAFEITPDSPAQTGEGKLKRDFPTLKGLGQRACVPVTHWL